MGATGDTADPNFMQSLARGLAVLRAFEGQPSLSMAEAARISGLNRPSTARCLFTLVRLGYVRASGGRYMLRPGLLPLACELGRASCRGRVCRYGWISGVVGSVTKTITQLMTYPQQV